jgi:hypothetical protein
LARTILLLAPVTIATLPLKEGGADALMRAASDHIVAGRRQSLTDADGLVRLELERRLDDRFAIFIGGDIFYGARSGMFGQFSDRSRFVSGIRFSL